MNRRRLATFGEQAILSGANFLAVLYAARALSKEQFGIFGIAYAIVMFVQGFQRAFVIVPMISFAATSSGLMDTAHIWRRLQLKNLCISFAVLVVAGIALLSTNFDALGWGGLYAALIIPSLFAFEFVRRWTILEGAFSRLIPMALIYAASYVGLMYILLRVVGGAPAIALSLAIAGLVAAIWGWRRAQPSHFFEASAASKIDRHELKSFGRNAALGHLAFSMYTTIIQLSLGWISGPASVAVMLAARNIGQPIQTLISAVDSSDKPRAAAALKMQGLPGLQRAVASTRLTLALLGGGYILVVALFGDELLKLLYGSKYSESGDVLNLWLIVFALMLVTQPLESALYVLKRADRLWRGRLIAAVTSVVCIPIFIPQHGEIGAVVCMAVGWCVSWCVAYVQVTRLLREGKGGPA